MNHRKQSIIMISILVIAMFAVGFLVANSKDSITGRAIKKELGCKQNSDCNDHDKNTEDICLYPDSSASVCQNIKK